MSVLADLLNGVLRLEPSAEVIDYQATWYNWAALAATIDSISDCMTALGLGVDARIGVLLHNRPDALAGLLATVANKATVVSVNPLYPDERLCADIKALKLPVLIANGDLAREGVLQALKDAGTAVIQTAPILGQAVLKSGFETFDQSKTEAKSAGVLIEMLTSGTTGVPKRVPLQRKAFEQSFQSALSYEKGRKPGDAASLRPGTQLLTNPMTHIGGLWGALNTILGGRKICIVEKFTVQDWRDAVVRHRPKVASAVPAGLRMILDADLPADDLSSIVALRTGAAPLDPAIVAEFWQRYQIPVLQNYGATEFSGSVAGWSMPDFKAFHDSKAGSVGRFQPGITGRVIDPDSGAELSAGEEGVLEMKAEQFGNGDQWLRTTDRAMIDDDGFLYIRGRADNAIIRGGFKVHPDDVVAVLEQHPAVREAVVVGIEDRRLGAVPAAAIILRRNVTELAEAELSAFAKQRLLPYQVPMRYLFVDDVPRTPSMKPSLPYVKEMFG